VEEAWTFDRPERGRTGTGASRMGAGMNTGRILLADDDAEIRGALEDLINSDPHLEVVGIASDRYEAVEMALALRPDVAVIDVRMPGGGAAATRAISEESPETRIVALSAYDDRATVASMLSAGAIGYLVKGAPAREILQTVHRARRGESSLSAEVATEMLHELAGRLRKEESTHRVFQDQRKRIERVLAGDGIRLVFQPVFDLKTGTVLGVEALSRFEPDGGMTPDRWFEAAWQVGLGLELELATARMGLEHLERIPQTVHVMINLSPGTAISPRFVELASRFPAGRIVVEVTEHARVDDYEALNGVLHPLRRQGLRLAVDDAGAGFASLRHILQLAPDLIKLDGSITAGIDKDASSRALASALTSFAAEIGAIMTAEGIETENELVALRAMGVPQGQGYFLARPGPLPWPDVRYTAAADGGPR
jgi:EAL domain-containing protein (putative c-di-GMP-specific phosphodiesterase class I)/AmiR/NasT family two-component response regulator